MIFSKATAVTCDAEGRFSAELDDGWSIGRRLHGGYLLATAVRAATETAAEHTPDPVAVSAQFFRPGVPGKAIVRTELLKQGRTVAVVRAVLEQDGVACVEATVNAGRLSEVEPLYAEPPDAPLQPGDDAIATTDAGDEVFALSRQCDVRLDPATAPFLSGATGPPRLHVWARPHGEEPDLLFAMLAGDISMPAPFNLGHVGWSPTVQLTALLRAHPAPGWLSVAVESRWVQGGWFDEDATVRDSTGRVVCQARQLALLPQPRA